MSTGNREGPKGPLILKNCTGHAWLSIWGMVLCDFQERIHHGEVSGHAWQDMSVQDGRSWGGAYPSFPQSLHHSWSHRKSWRRNIGWKQQSPGLPPNLVAHQGREAFEGGSPQIFWQQNLVWAGDRPRFYVLDLFGPQVLYYKRKGHKRLAGVKNLNLEAKSVNRSASCFSWGRERVTYPNTDGAVTSCQFYL